MSQEAQVIELLTDANGSFIHDEEVAASGSAIVPGMLVEEVAGGTVQEHSTAAANAQKLFALANIANGGTIDDVYAVGETVRYGAAHSGQKAFALVAASAIAIVRGDVLESAGDGTVRKATADAATDTSQRDSIVGYAREAVDNSGGGTTARLRIRVA
jgi:hypothetical protein